MGIHGRKRASGQQWPGLREHISRGCQPLHLVFAIFRRFCVAVNTRPPRGDGPSGRALRRGTRTRAERLRTDRTPGPHGAPDACGVANTGPCLDHRRRGACGGGGGMRRWAAVLIGWSCPTLRSALAPGASTRGLCFRRCLSPRGRPRGSRSRSLRLSSEARSEGVRSVPLVSESPAYGVTSPSLCGDRLYELGNHGRIYVRGLHQRPQLCCNFEVV